MKRCYAATALFCVLILAGCASMTPPAGKGEAGDLAPKTAVRKADWPPVVEPGDLVGVEVTASLEDGQVFYTSSPKVDQDPAIRKAPMYRGPEGTGPLEVVAGGDSFLPGLGEAVLGARPGGEWSVLLPPEKAFGMPDPGKIMDLPRVKSMKRSIVLGPQEYVEQFQSFPVQGARVGVTPYFPAEVVSVFPDHVALRLLAEDGMEVKETFGTARVRVSGEDVDVILEPTLGAVMEIGGIRGRIVSSDARNFTVDANPPMAGRNVVYSILVTGVDKAADLGDLTIPWITDYGLALGALQEEQKPLVLLLYAHWCSFSKRLLNETLTDPRILKMADSFVWAKVDSSSDQGLQDMFEQDGYPLILVMSPGGEVLARLDGFRDATTFKRELNAALDREEGRTAARQ